VNETAAVRPAQDFGVPNGGDLPPDRKPGHVDGGEAVALQTFLHLLRIDDVPSLLRCLSTAHDPQSLPKRRFPRDIGCQDGIA
jgi:hypothetical protein